MDSTRISKKKIKLASDKLYDFFQKRSLVSSESNPYVSVVYQDKNSEVAVYRDKAEKKTITPKLCLEKHHNLLDIGCGIGRWPDKINECIKHYVGVDFSDELIKIAKDRYKDKSNVEFKVLSAQNVSTKTLFVENYFHRVIIAGVLIYLNDEEIVDCFSNMQELLAKDALIYIREPLALEERLTLNGFWSNELEQHYYGIYRTKEELADLINEGLGFKTSISFKPLYEENLGNNRKETAQFYDIIRISS